MPGSPSAGAPTPDRLLAAATDLFARAGFRGTSIRDIAGHAGANVASAHYHYGSKESLYLEVLRGQFARARANLARHGVPRGRRALAGASRRTLVALLETRVAAMLDFLLGPPPGPHGALMMREMCDPTDALPLIVAEFMRPQLREVEALVARLAPGADRDSVLLAALSVVGQVLFYRFSMPALLLVLQQPAYPRGFARRLARHITAFSLGGLGRVGTTRRRSPGVGTPRQRRHGR